MLPPEGALLAEFNSLTRAFVDDIRRQRQGKISESRLDNYRCIARHFLIWLNLTRIEMRTVDGSIIHRFLQHDCRYGASCASVRLKRWNRCRTSAKLMRFVRFLENAGQIDTTGELEDNLRLLDAFLAGLCVDGYTVSSVKSYRFACTGFIVWLHLSRIRLCDLTSDVFAQYQNREFVCSIPGLFSSRRKQGTEARHGSRRRHCKCLLFHCRCRLGIDLGGLGALMPEPECDDFRRQPSHVTPRILVLHRMGRDGVPLARVRQAGLGPGHGRGALPDTTPKGSAQCYRSLTLNP